MSSNRRRASSGARLSNALLLGISTVTLLHCGSESSPASNVGGLAPGGSSNAGGSGGAASVGGATSGGASSGGASSGGSDPAAGGAAGGAAGEVSSGEADAGTDDAGARGTLGTTYDWNGVVGTGQSLSVGEPGAASGTPAGVARLTQQPFNNLKLATGALPWPVDSSDPSLSMVPLVEPLGRFAPNYPSS